MVSFLSSWLPATAGIVAIFVFVNPLASAGGDQIATGFVGLVSELQDHPAPAPPTAPAPKGTVPTKILAGGVEVLKWTHSAS